MSLINEALKKAQSQRTNPPITTPPANTPPGSPPPSAPGTANNAAPQPSPFNKIGVLIAICAVIVSLSVLATVFLLRSSAPASTPAANASASAARSASADTNVGPKPATLAVSTAIAPASAPAAAPSTPIQAASTANSTNSAPAAVSVTSVPTAVAATTTPVPTVAPEPTPIKVTVRVQALVDKFRISGIRLSDTDSKVILNDHLFRVDDPVESSLGLRLTKIEEHRLTFVDADGNTYVKRF